MSNATVISGVLAPVITPFDEDLRPDAERLLSHCRWLVGNGSGLALFGTNSEANSLTTAEKLSLLNRLVEAGLPAVRMMPGTGCCALTDSVELTRKAVELGVAGVLMLPPFYYKDVSEEGLYRSFAEVIERVGDPRLRIYLYHIPPVAQVPISLNLIERLLKAYPGTVAGIKDSSGDWSNTEAMLRRFQPEGFDVFVGSESFLLANLRGGGAGCISATANVNPAAIARLARTWQEGGAESQQQALDRVRGIFQGYVMIPALKAAVSHYSQDANWDRVRPPLVEFSPQEKGKLAQQLEAAGFTMPGLEAAAA
jgi:4-hydroxy-tetrahydrodipicolinate synthase